MVRPLLSFVVGSLVAVSVVAVSVTPTSPGPAKVSALSFTNILFDRPGAIPKFGPNEVVEIMAGNINYIGGKVAAGPGGALVDACAAEPNGLGLRANVGINDSIQPFADLYLVPAGRQPSNNEKLVDVAGAPNSVFGGLGGTFLYEPLGLTFPAGKIGAGVYAIVVDECQDGYFNTNEDSFVDDAFWVDLDQDVPPLSPAAAQFQEMKVRAQQLDTGLRTIEEILKIKAILAKVQEVQSVAQAAVSVQGFATFAIGVAIGAIQEQSGYNAAKARAEDTIKTTITQHLTRYRRLAADPPQADFRRPATPIVEGAYWEESDDPFTEAIGLYMAHHDALSGLSGVLLDAIERYQGESWVSVVNR